MKTLPVKIFLQIAKENGWAYGMNGGKIDLKKGKKIDRYVFIEHDFQCYSNKAL